MGASLPGKSSGGRGRYRPLAEINVTPLVDVMLVLLIIFMVTAPMLTSGVNVNLPKASASALSQEKEPLTVSVTAEGKVYLQDTEVQLPELVAKLQAIAQNDADRRILVRGDKSVPYGQVMQVMATIAQGGFTKVAMLTEGEPAATPAGATSPGSATSGSQSSGAAPAATGTPAAQPAPAASGRG